MSDHLIQASRDGSVAIRLRPALIGAARLPQKAAWWLFRVLRRWREEEELHRYLRSASPAERADLQAIGVQLPPPFPTASSYGSFDPHWLR